MATLAHARAGAVAADDDEQSVRAMLLSDIRAVCRERAASKA